MVGKEVEEMVGASTAFYDSDNGFVEKLMPSRSLVRRKN